MTRTLQFARRQISCGLAASLIMPIIGRATAQTSEQRPVTPACADGDEPTPRQSTGPYYLPGSRERRDFSGDVGRGEAILVSGHVLDTRCRPVAAAMIDIWHADAEGIYDEDGPRLRGHQFSGEDGRWQLRTVVPGLYPGRTRHFHVRVQAPGGSILTTQLYFPFESRNASDPQFRPELLIDHDRPNGEGRFDFILNGT